MNMEGNIASVAPVSHATAYAAVDAWRGRCVRHFAKLEQAIARFLAEHYANTNVGGHGLGCRLKQLTAFLDKAPQPNIALQKAIRALEPAKVRREAVVHGDGIIYVSKNGDWLWDCAYLDTRKEASTMIFREQEANSFEKQLKTQVQSLCDRLINYEVA